MKHIQGYMSGRLDKVIVIFRMLASQTRRVSFASLLLVFLLSISVAIFSPVVVHTKVQAAGEEYIVDLKQGGLQPGSDTAASKIYGKGGVFGNRAITFNRYSVPFPPTQPSSSANTVTKNTYTILSQHLLEYYPLINGQHSIYSAQYSCGGTKVTLFIGLSTAPTSTEHGAGQKTYGAYLWNPQPYGKTAKCLPQGANDIAKLSSPTQMGIPSYRQLDSKKQKDWHQFLKGKGITIDEPGSAALGTGPSPTDADSSDDSSSTDDSPPSCESSGFWDGSWAFCFIINGAADFIHGIYANLIEPLLQVNPINITEPGEDDAKTFAIWSNFRIYGNVLLVIVLLIIVISEAVGGSVVDAYTVRKTLPRLLVAAILINLSIYIVAFAVDVTNIVGRGIEALIEAPFRGVKDGFQLSFGSGGPQLLAGGATGAIMTGVWAAVASGSALASVMQLFLFFVLIPTVIAFMGIVATILIRTGLIVLLTVVSPVAFALYCLPNTEQYFRRWWDLLFRTLLVYPIIAVTFAIGNVLAVTINASAAGLSKGFAEILSVVGLMLPLFMIPFSFRIAGGVLGQIHEQVSKVGQRANKAFDGRREHAAHDWEGRKLQHQEKAYDFWNRRGFKGSKFVARSFGGYDMKGRLSAYNAKQQKIMEETKNFGDDSEIRAITVDKKRALEHGIEGEDWQNGEHGREFRTAGGAWVSEAAVDQAYHRNGGNQSAYQFAMAYEMSKALTQEEQDRLLVKGGELLGDDGAWGKSMTQGQRIGLWKGAAFKEQNTSKQWKHYTPGTGDDDGQLRVSGLGFMREMSEKVGSGQAAGMSADTYTTMEKEIVRAHHVLTRHAAGDGDYSDDDAIEAQEVLERAQQVKSSITSEGAVPIMGDDGQPTGQTRTERTVLYGAPGATKAAATEAIDTLYRLAELNPETQTRPSSPTEILDRRDPRRQD